MSWYEDIFQNIISGQELLTPGRGIPPQNQKRFEIKEVTEQSLIIRVGNSQMPVRLGREVFEAIERHFQHNPNDSLRVSSLHENDPLPNSIDAIVRAVRNSKLACGNYVSSILVEAGCLEYVIVRNQKCVVLPNRPTVGPNGEANGLETNPRENIVTLNDFVLNFDSAHQNFYSSNASYKNFREGPCIHFHKKAITMWQEKIYQGNSTYYSILSTDEYPEAIYATLTAWGMNRPGGGPKLKDYDEFKQNLISLSDHFEQIRNLNILSIELQKEIVKNIYSALDPSRNIRDLVVKSKTLHHLNPEIFPPIDKEYTLKLLTTLRGLAPIPSVNGIDFDNYWRILTCFRVLVNCIGEQIVRGYLMRNIMDTSLTKVMDNAIVGFSDL